MKYIISKLFLLSILFTILSQAPQVLELNLSIYLQLTWFVLLITLFVAKGIYLSKPITAILLLVVLTLVYALSMEAFTYKNYMASAHFMNITKSFFILALSFYAAKYISEEKFKSALVLVSLIGGIVLTIAVYQHSFASGFDVTSRIYAYAAKNSVSQIILSCLIIVLFLTENKSFIFKIANVIFILFALYVVFVLKSRATIFGLVFVAIALLVQSKNKKLKYVVLLVLIASTAILFFNQELFAIFYNNILLGSREGDINEISSGRFDMYKKFPELFSENILFGHGELFIESFPLSVLIDFGLLGGIAIFLFVYAPIRFFKRNLSTRNSLHLAFLLLIITFYFNGIFEQQAPLGPGSKNFMLWVIFGFLLQKQINQSKRDSVENSTNS